MKTIVTFLIVSVLIFMPVSHSLSIVPVADSGTQTALTGTNKMLAKLNMTLGKLNINEQKESFKRIKRQMEKAKKILRSSKQFLQHAEEIKRTANILSSMYCMLDDIAALQKQKKQLLNFSNCYADLQFDIYTLRLGSQITTLTQLFKEALDVSALTKIDTWKQINEDLAALGEDMHGQIKAMKKEIFKAKRKKNRQEMNRQRILDKSSLYFSQSYPEKSGLPLLD